MTLRLAERLLDARRRRFVGRTTERTLFSDALDDAALPFHVLHVYGAGGIGKTSLLRMFADQCRQEGVRHALLDAHHLDPNPQAFLEALGAALRLAPGETPVDALGAGRRAVLLLDTYEALAPLDGWLREVFLPELPDRVLIVTAGRQPLAAAWHADPGWQALLRELPLRALSREESRAYLAQRNVAAEQHDAALAFTRGHPLALSLVVDLVEQRPGLSFQPEAQPDVIKALLDRFVLQVPGPAHRAALEACALVRVVNETLLAELLDAPDAHDVFEWMRRVSFIESGPYGLYPHDLARDALVADLRWRNPDGFAELHHRARTYYGRRLKQTRGQAQQRVLSDYMYLHRDNPVIRPFLDWQETGSAVPDVATGADHPVLVDLIGAHEGEASARLLAYWLERQPDHVLVFRDPRGALVAFVTMLALDATDEADRRVDPAVAAACRYLEHGAPLRSGDRATLFRFWAGRDAYQSVSPEQSLIFLKLAQHYLTTQDLAFSFFPCADPDFWAPFCAYVELDRLPEADFEVDGRRYGVFGHDWRAVPPLTWLDRLAEKEILTSQEPAPPPAAGPPVLPDRDAFAAAVWDALRAYSRPYTLRDNPLLRARIVQQAAGTDAGEGARIEAVRTLLREAAAQMEAMPREQKLYRALHRAYLKPAPSQEQAAEALGLPFSTFRRHLKAGVLWVADYLWQRETGAPFAGPTASAK